LPLCLATKVVLPYSLSCLLRYTDILPKKKMVNGDKERGRQGDKAIRLSLRAPGGSAAIPFKGAAPWDCRVVSLLAMTSPPVIATVLRTSQ